MIGIGGTQTDKKKTKENNSKKKAEQNKTKITEQNKNSKVLINYS